MPEVTLEAIISVFIQLLASALLLAVVAQYATKIITGFKPPYWMAYKAALLAYSFSMSAKYFAEYSINTVLPEAYEINIIFTTSIGFVVSAYIYSFMLKNQDSKPVGFSIGCQVSILAVIIIDFVLAMILPLVHAFV